MSDGSGQHPTLPTLDPNWKLYTKSQRTQLWNEFMHNLELHKRPKLIAARETRLFSRHSRPGDPPPPQHAEHSLPDPHAPGQSGTEHEDAQTGAENQSPHSVSDIAAATPSSAGELVQFSARLTARIRHAERLMEVPLFTDPYAGLFCSEDAVASQFDHTHFLYRKMFTRFTKITGGARMDEFRAHYAREALRLRLYRAARPFIAVRTRWIDDLIRVWVRTLSANLPAETVRGSGEADGLEGKTITSSTTAPATLQIMILGCGFDTRAYRLGVLVTPQVTAPNQISGKPVLHFYEVDQREVLQFKESRLAKYVRDEKVNITRCHGNFAGRSSQLAPRLRLACERPTQEQDEVSIEDDVQDATFPRNAKHEDEFKVILYTLAERGKGLDASKARKIEFEATRSQLMSGVSGPKDTVPDEETKSNDGVPAVVRTSWVLDCIAKGFNPYLPTLIIIEGVLMYLPRFQADELLGLASALASCNPASRIIGDTYSPAARSEVGGSYYAMFQSGVAREELKSWLTSVGLDMTFKGVFAQQPHERSDNMEAVLAACAETFLPTCEVKWNDDEVTYVDYCRFGYNVAAKELLKRAQESGEASTNYEEMLQSLIEELTEEAREAWQREHELSKNLSKCSSPIEEGKSDSAARFMPHTEPLAGIDKVLVHAKHCPSLQTTRTLLSSGYSLRFHKYLLQLEMEKTGKTEMAELTKCLCTRAFPKVETVEYLTFIARPHIRMKR